MASPLNAVLCALVATAFWTVLGYALARHVMPRVLALGAAPVIGWAGFSAATLPILTLIGFSLPAVVGIAALALLIAGGSFVVGPVPVERAPSPGVPLSSFAASAVLALVPASAILPKISAGAVRLADPIFDHAKIAIIDAMTRQGLPPVNPVVGEFGAAGRLAYYYLWHFSAAELALPLHATGWEADIALTWFTAFASLALMMSIAVWLSKSSAAGFIVVALAAAASLRETSNLLFGSYRLEPFLASPTGFAGWLFQSAWVPQHLMAASCTVAAMILLVQYAERQSAARLLSLALMVAAGFESSAYVGGVTFAAAAVAATPILLVKVAPARRTGFAAGLAGAAVLALALAAPFIRDQLAVIAARGGGSPIVFHPFEVLGTMFSPTARRALDAPAYWLILLPVELPATFIAGTIALLAAWRGGVVGVEKTTVAVLSVLAGAGLVIAWLLFGTLGDNNDLALRAVLPPAMILIVAASAGMMRSRWRIAIAATALAGFLLSLPDTAAMIHSNFVGNVETEDRIFSQTPELWAAVRRYTPPSARIANNPLYLQDLTPWPVNIGWALLADRSSCFAGREMALAFAALPSERREAINTQFIRVFGGKGTPADIDDLANKFGCDVVVVVPQDPAWANDPFAASSNYRLAEMRDGQWRIYVRSSSGSGHS
jgi:hypothetical protein